MRPTLIMLEADALLQRLEALRDDPPAPDGRLAALQEALAVLLAELRTRLSDRSDS